MIFAFVMGLLAASAVANVEAPYAFKQRLVTVHRFDRRDFTQKALENEFEFKNGMQIVIPDAADGLVKYAAEDFREYLLQSMSINASVRLASAKERPGLERGVVLSLSRKGKPGFAVDVVGNCVSVDATDSKMAAQAFYYLEDRMNFRKGPFLKIGKYSRTPMFAHRYTFSGYGNDLFPDEHLKQIAHHGFTGIEVWLADYDIISQGPRQDVNDLIERAAKYGLGVFIQTRSRAFVHPDDPKAKEIYEKAYGKITQYYPKAEGIFFCGDAGSLIGDGVTEFDNQIFRRSDRGFRQFLTMEIGEGGQIHTGKFSADRFGDRIEKFQQLSAVTIFGNLFTAGVTLTTFLIVIHGKVE